MHAVLAGAIGGKGGPEWTQRERHISRSESTTGDMLNAKPNKRTHLAGFL